MRWFVSQKIPDFEKHRGKVALITGVRTLFYLAILTISLVFQLRQNTFFSPEGYVPVYMLLITAFILNSIYLFYFDAALKIWQSTAFLFIFDTVFITGLILTSGVQQSIFLFLYLINIIVCGFVFQRRGAFLLALLTSICFSFLLVIGPDVVGQTLYYVVGLNNLAFFVVAGLSGYLSEQLNFMGAELFLKKRDIKVLKDLNKVIVDNISAGLVTIDLENRIVLANRAAQKILGNPRLVGIDIDQIFPGTKELIQEIDKKAGQKPNLSTRFERRYNSFQGEKLTLGFSVSTMLSSEDVANGHIIIFQDLTEISKLENQMRRQEKLAAVGKLAAGIAHEIRNPLASISGSVELIKSIRTSSSPDEAKLMEIVIKEIDRLNGLITDFLNFVRPEDKKDTPVFLNKILNEVLDMVKLNKNLNQTVVQYRKLEAEGAVLGDTNTLRQVFYNFVINAYQAMSESQVKELHVETHTNKDGNIVVLIRDTGAGMSEATQKRLFEPFFTTKSKGTGLGLATAHKILETHDAKIFVESREGNGTEFKIEFYHTVKLNTSQQLQGRAQ